MVGLFELLCLSLINAVGSLVSIFPGNFVVQEVLIALTSKLIGVGIEQGLVVAAIIRLASMLSAFGFGVFGTGSCDSAMQTKLKT